MKTFHLIFLSILILLLTSCHLSNHLSDSSPLSRTNYVLGTVVTVSLYDHQSAELLDTAFDLLSQIENTLSINKTGTLIEQINQNAGSKPTKVDSQTYQLLQKGIEYSKLTSGAFDITIGPLVKLWDIGFSSAHLPSQTEINQTLPLINYQWLHFDDSSQSVYLEKEGMLLDLGGIGKGYAADQVATLLREAGVTHAIINIGGNIYALGTHPDNPLWTIGIQDPFNPRGETIGTVCVCNQSVVTSGIYERYFTAEDGTTYHHLLNPKTGYPFTNKLASVTIISANSIDGDALSTAAFALGLDDGLNFIENLEDTEAIFITTNKKVYLTSGISSYFTLTSSNFTLCT